MTVTENPLRVVVAEKEDEGVRQISDLITARRQLVVGAVTSSGMALARIQQLQPDALVTALELQDGLMKEVVAQVLAEELCAVVLLVPPDAEFACPPPFAEGVHGCLRLPVDADDLLLVLKVATAIHWRMRSLAGRAARAEQRLADHRVIDQAKGVLQEEYGLSEQEAYARLRRLSMNERCNMRMVADAVLLNHKLQRQAQ